MIAAITSGSGKTSFTCALSDIFKKSGTDVSLLKCGPDYIDVMFHQKILGVQSDNIDPFFSDEEDCKKIVAKASGDLLIIEGAMGIYDGITGAGIQGSCYDIAQKTQTPIILIVDMQKTGYTIIPLLSGILAEDSTSLIKGIIFNRISDNFFSAIRDQIKRRSEFKNVKILGGISRIKDVGFDSRYLGLLMPDEISDFYERINRFSDALKSNINLDELEKISEDANYISISNSAPENGEENSTVFFSLKPPLTLAVAKDDAFCFYYKRNLEEFKQRGVTLAFFSPITDEKIPDNASGLLLGGGYPELYSQELSKNISMKESVKKAIHSGMPSLAECGGFMYLLDGITKQVSYSMVGIIEGKAFDTGGLVRFGYGTITSDRGLLEGLEIRGHEFHHYDTKNAGCDCIMTHPKTGRSHPCMHMSDDHLWGFAHLYYPSCPEFVDRFIKKMEEYNAK